MAEQTFWRTRMMMRFQSLMILLLLILVAEEYNFDESFQDWANGGLGGLGFLLGGSVAAVYAGVLIALYLSPPPVPSAAPKREGRILVVVERKIKRKGS